MGEGWFPSTYLAALRDAMEGEPADPGGRGDTNGVFGGKIICCRGGRGESGADAPASLADSGAEAECGMLPNGRGVEGKPGLSNGMGISSLFGASSSAFKEVEFPGS